jgi:hypothetical protein
MSRGAASTPAELFAGTDRRGRVRVRWATPAWLAVVGAMLLSAIGIASIALTRPELAARQGAFLAIGIAAASLTTFFSPRSLRISCWVVLAISVALLVFVLLPFVPRSIVTPRNGARAWINLGAADFQPSELAKIASSSAPRSGWRCGEARARSSRSPSRSASAWRWSASSCSSRISDRRCSSCRRSSRCSSPPARASATCWRRCSPRRSRRRSRTSPC